VGLVAVEVAGDHEAAALEAAFVAFWARRRIGNRAPALPGRVTVKGRFRARRTWVNSAFQR
jgi:hypothetical protein